MSGQHTPGPWTNEDQIIYGNGEEVAEVYGNSQGHADANARLIAEAPAMRATIEARVSVCCGLQGGTACTFCTEDRALLARIDGEPEATR